MKLFEFIDRKPEIIEHSGNRLVARSLVSLAGTVNANKRRYSEKLWDRILNDKELLENLNSRRVIGELDHPSDGQTKLERGSHIVTKLEKLNGNQIWGTEEILGTPHGKILREYINSGVQLGVSTRGDGTVSEGDDGIAEVNEDYHFETFDHVLKPSSPGSYISSITTEGVKEVATLVEAVNSLVKSGSCNSKDLATYSEMIERMLAQTDQYMVERKSALTKAQEAIAMQNHKCTCSVPSSVKEESRMSEVLESKDTKRITELEAQISTLQSENKKLTDRLTAAVSLGEELKVVALQNKVNADHFRDLYENSSGDSEKVRWMKKLVQELANRLKSMPVLERRYAAAEKLLAAFVGKTNSTQLEKRIEKLLSKESKTFVEEVKPQLLRCRSEVEAIKLFESFKKVGGRSSKSNVLPLSNGRSPIREVKLDREPISVPTDSNYELPKGVPKEALSLAENLQ